MGDILPECLEVQFGWIKKFAYTAQAGRIIRTANYEIGTKAIILRLIESGSLLYSSDCHSWHLGSGSIILQPPFPPGTMTCTQVVEPGESIGIGFRLLLFGNVDITPQLLHSSVVWHPDDAEFEALGAMIRLLLLRSNPATMQASFIRDGLLRAIIGLIWAPLGMEHLTEGQHPRVPKWLAFVMQELRHYPGMTVNDLERLTGYSHTHLDRLFSQHVNTSPREYLLKYRFDLAKHLLLTTEMSINAIAEHLGFANATGFNRFFRRMSLMPPSEYRLTKDVSSELPMP